MKEGQGTNISLLDIAPAYKRDYNKCKECKQRSQCPEAYWRHAPNYVQDQCDHKDDAEDNRKHTDSKSGYGYSGTAAGTGLAG